MEETAKGRKSLRDISWKVSEAEYRADDALSYSLLARYEREGFGGLDRLFEHVETPSLTFGSAVDTILTEGTAEFRKKFVVSDMPDLSETLTAITELLYSRYKGEVVSLPEIPDSAVADAGKELGYYASDKFAVYRVRKIRESCSEFYDTLRRNDGRKVITKAVYEDVFKCVSALRNSPATREYFGTLDSADGNVERACQLKFRMSSGCVSYRCMPDLVVVRHRKREIIPVDLKTSSSPEWEFPKSFVKWNYQIQARLYYRILKYNMELDEYFRDFTIRPYRFVVVCRRTLKPLVWECPFTAALGSIRLGGDRRIVMRDPYEIGGELALYLTARPDLPIGVSDGKGETNNIELWINDNM